VSREFGIAITVEADSASHFRYRHHFHVANRLQKGHAYRLAQGLPSFCENLWSRLAYAKALQGCYVSHVLKREDMSV
jgi:hypothetical protein